MKTGQHSQDRVASRAAVVWLLAVVVIVWATFSPASSYGSGLFQSGLPTRPPNPNWISTAAGGQRQCGSATITIPAGYTQQAGASVLCDPLAVSPGIPLGSQDFRGTLFALGIWPNTDQTAFNAPLRIDYVLNPATFPDSLVRNLRLAQYDGAAGRWLLLPTTFDAANRTLSTSFSTLTPVAKDRPEGWGWRTFYVVTQAGGQAPSVSPQGAFVSRSANVRSGPGTQFTIVRKLTAGTPVVPTGKSADGKWLQLDDGSWIAAFLVTGAPRVPVVQ